MTGADRSGLLINWTFAEIKARLAVLLPLWALSVSFIISQYLRGRKPGPSATAPETTASAVNWQGGTIEVQARLVPRWLWCTASIEVLLDGRCILETGGSLKATGSREVTFARAGSRHTAKLSWGWGFLRSFPYKLRLDGAAVSEARVRVRNWPMVVVFPLVLGALWGALSHFIHGLGAVNQ
jgi:hypothetical protein